MLNADERLPLYQRLKDDMMAKIANREWLPELAIPTEIELSKAYSVSIGTIRKAVEVLVAEGLLERSQGRGTFIRKPTFVNSLFRFFRFHSGTSGSGGTPVPSARILARQLAEPPEPVAAALKLNKRSKVIRLDRLRLFQEKPLLIEEIWLPHTKFARLMEIDTSAFGDLLYPLYEQLCGQTVASAQETLTIESASPDVAEQLQIALNQPVVVIDRLASGYDNQPLEWRRSRGPADQFHYQVDIR